MRMTVMIICVMPMQPTVPRVRRAADAPSAQYEPASHATHAVCCGCSWYVPAAHLSHAPCATAGCTVPGLHAVGCSAPVLQKKPAAHLRHSPSTSSPLALPKRPAGHERAALLPKGAGGGGVPLCKSFMHLHLGIRADAMPKDLPPQWTVVNSWLNWGQDGVGKIALGQVGIGAGVEAAVMEVPASLESPERRATDSR